MKRDELFKQFQAWLESEKLNFQADPEDHDFQIPMNLDNGSMNMRVICEESPDLLQLLCSFPIKVPREKLQEIEHVLHRINARLRIGAFCLVAKQDVISYRIAIPLPEGADLPGQFSQAIVTALGTVDVHLRLLAFVVSGTKEVREMATELTSDTPANETPHEQPTPRFELN